VAEDKDLDPDEEEEAQSAPVVNRASGRPERRPGALRLLGVALLAVIVVLLAIQVVQNARRSDSVPIPSFSTPYQAVLLSSGLAYFGKVESRGPRFLVLTDVYYVQTRMAPGAKGQQTQSNVLVKRGSEWHAPDRMAINIDAIIFMEPVGADSQLAHLIAQNKK
jgi:hypothetical protein